MPLTLKEIKGKLQNLERLRELRREDFAEEGGYADSLAEDFRDNLKPTQLFKVFHEIKRVQRRIRGNPDEKFDRGEILGLLPILAYSTGRGLMPKDFYDILKICLSKEKLEINKDFLRLAEFMEAIIAYHKYYKYREATKGGSYGI